MKPAAESVPAALCSTLSADITKAIKELVVVNSGGFSKRTMCCAVKGKAFAHTLCEGQPATLLEHIISNTAHLAESFNEGVLICCSDIFVNTEEIKPDFKEQNACVKFSHFTQALFFVFNLPQREAF